LTIGNASLGKSRSVKKVFGPIGHGEAGVVIRGKAAALGSLAFQFTFTHQFRFVPVAGNLLIGSFARRLYPLIE
jgi:hypothetical protein